MSGSDSVSARTAARRTRSGRAGVLTEIGYLRQSGHTLRGIAASLNRQSLGTRRGSAWRGEHVARIIKQANGPR
jgi:hypothetical protein